MTEPPSAGRPAHPTRRVAGKERTVWVHAGGHSRMTWPTDDGRYDITVTAGTGTRFAQRYAGTVHTV
ncbi:phospholipase domain-containing protein [Streptomyces sp. 900116325]